MAWLVLARVLVATLRFRRWQHLLGPRQHAATHDAAAHGGGVTMAEWRLADAVERAAARLPLTTRCLPRAMALHWMLRRRNRASQLALAVLPGTHRGGLDDLHAWVKSGGTVLIGASDEPYHVLISFGTPMGA